LTQDLLLKGKLQYHHRRLTTSEYHHRKRGNSYITIQKVAKLISPVAQTYITIEKSDNSYITIKKVDILKYHHPKSGQTYIASGQTYITIESDVSNHNNNHPTTNLDFVWFRGRFHSTCSVDLIVQIIWNRSNGQCMVTAHQEEGVHCMTTIADKHGTEYLLLGLASGKLCVRSLLTTPPALTTIFVLRNYNKYPSALTHCKTVRSVCKGLDGIFFTTGDDGRVFVYEAAAFQY
jgi:hypothetical protein